MPYEIKKYQRSPDMRAPEELKAVNPLGTAPVITDGGVHLAESGAIVGASLFWGRYHLAHTSGRTSSTSATAAITDWKGVAHMTEDTKIRDACA